MTDFIIDNDGEAKPADNQAEAEDIIEGLLNDGVSPTDIEVSIVVRERITFRVTGVELRRKDGRPL